ncbi:hypothetical protein VPH35_082410 [Triticum aestivum]
MISGGGRNHGLLAIGDGLIRCTSTLRRSRGARRAPILREGLVHDQWILKSRLVIQNQIPFLHYIMCAAVHDYNAKEEWCCRLLLRKREQIPRSFWRRKGGRRRRGRGRLRRGRLGFWNRRGTGTT